MADPSHYSARTWRRWRGEVIRDTKLYASCKEDARACDEGIDGVSSIEDVPDRVSMHQGREEDGDEGWSDERGQLEEHHFRVGTHLQ